MSALDMNMLTEMNAAPEGMIETACGFTLPDTARSRLTALIHEAYETTDFVSVRIDQQEPFALELGRDMIEAEPTSLGGIELGTPATMKIEQIDENTYRLTEVLEEWMGEPRIQILQVSYQDPRD